MNFEENEERKFKKLGRNIGKIWERVLELMCPRTTKPMIYNSITLKHCVVLRFVDVLLKGVFVPSNRNIYKVSLLPKHTVKVQ